MCGVFVAFCDTGLQKQETLSKVKKNTLTTVYGIIMQVN